MTEKHWAMCNHCNEGYETHRDSEGLCIPCFIKGHRGRTCDEYCKTEPEPVDPQITRAFAILYGVKESS